MILVSGFGTEGTLMCTFPLELPSVETDGWCPSQPSSASMDTMAPVLPWKLPPPNGVWYSCNGDKYGPQPTVWEPGFIQSSNAQKRFKPCLHSTLSGYLHYSGPDDVNSVNWRRPSEPRTNNWFVGKYDAKPDLSFAHRLFALCGNSYDIYGPHSVYDFEGNVVDIGYLGSLNQWHLINVLPSDLGPVTLKRTLYQENIHPYSQGSWYASNVYGNKPVSFADNVTLVRTTWDFPSRSKWTQHLITEYHTGASYTPESSVGFSEIGHTLSALSTTISYSIDKIQSTARGVYNLLFTTSCAYTGKGYQFPSSWHSSGKVKKTAHQVQLLVLQPGLQSMHPPDLNIALARQFCQETPRAIRDVIDFEPHLSKSRLAALSDTSTLNSNWIENLSGLSGTFDVVNPLIEGYVAVSTGNLRGARNALASAYLAYSFSVAPTVSDYHDVTDNTMTLLANLEKAHAQLGRQRGRENFSMPFFENKLSGYCATTYYSFLRDNRFSKLWAALNTLGLEPSATKAWDLVTLSFVSDWFMDIGQILSDISAYNGMRITRDIAARIESSAVRIALTDKQLFDIIGEGFTAVGRPLLYKWYEREIKNGTGEVNPFALSVSSDLSSTQIALGTSLITTILL